MSFDLPERWRNVLPWFVLVFALGARLGNWHAVAENQANGRPLFYSLVGVPYSDALAYELSAAEVSQGRDVPDWWRTRRQLWSYFLAMFYTWTGPDFDVARLVNIGCSVATVVFLYFAVERLGSWPVALASAVGISLDPNVQGMSLTLLSETFGLFLLAWHFERLITCLHTDPRGLFVSGVLLALSNVARSLTLFVAPLDLLAMAWFGWRRGARWGTTLVSMAAFAGGIAAIVVPYTALQYARTGIASMSDNMAMHLYCATSTEFPVWTHDVELVPGKFGFHDVKGKYDFFMKGAKEQFRKDPSVFFRNVWGSMGPPFQDAMRVAERPIFRKLLAATAILFIAAEWWRRIGRRVAPGPVLLWGIVLALVLYGLTPIVPRAVLISLCGLATVASLVERRNETLLVALLAATTIITSGIFVYWAEDRLTIFLQPLVLVLALAGVGILFRMGTAVLALKWEMPAVPMPTQLKGVATSVERPGPWKRYALVCCAGFVVLSAGRLVLLRVFPIPEPSVNREALSCEEVQQIVRFAMEQRPHLFTGQERERAQQPVSEAAGLPKEVFGTDYDKQKDGSLFCAYGIIDRYSYFLPRGIMTSSGIRFFRFRDYERSIVNLVGFVGCPPGYWKQLALFPGRSAYEGVGKSFIMIGRASYQPDNRYQEYMAEGIMLLPYDGATGAFDLRQAKFADHPTHQEFLRIQQAKVDQPFDEPSPNSMPPATSSAP